MLAIGDSEESIYRLCKLLTILIGFVSEFDSAHSTGTSSPPVCVLSTLAHITGKLLGMKGILAGQSHPFPTPVDCRRGGGNPGPHCSDKQVWAASALLEASYKFGLPLLHLHTSLQKGSACSSCVQPLNIKELSKYPGNQTRKCLARVSQSPLPIGWSSVAKTATVAEG